MFELTSVSNQIRLLDFLLDDAHMLRVYKHADGCVYLHHAASMPQQLSSFHRLPYVDVELAPVNIHPIDLWCSSRFTYCPIQTIVTYANKIFATNSNQLPPRAEFYNSPFCDGMRHGNQVRRTMLKLLTILIGIEGVEVVDLVDADSHQVFFHGNDEVPVRLLQQSGGGHKMWQQINQIIELEMGVSLVEVFAGNCFTFDNWAWFGFFVQPLFRNAHQIPNHPQAVVQVKLCFCVNFVCLFDQNFVSTRYHAMCRSQTLLPRRALGSARGLSTTHSTSPQSALVCSSRMRWSLGCFTSSDRRQSALGISSWWHYSISPMIRLFALRETWRCIGFGC